MTEAVIEPSELVIEAGRAERQYWQDLWLYRELFYFLAWRDILVRYKQTAIGIGWAILRPLVTMVIFTFVFGHITKQPFEKVPHPLLVLAAILPWQFFSNALSETSNSLIGNTNLISKVYFPRMIVPASAVITSLVDFFISLLLLAVLMVWYHFLPTWRMIVLPLLTMLAFVVALGPGLFMTALNVKYRDLRYVIPFMVQCGWFISPVGYSSERVPAQWRLVYSLNPMVGVIDGFRWALCGDSQNLYLPGFMASLVVSALLLWLGVWYFRRTEKSFADVI